MGKTQSAPISIIDRFASIDDPRMERAKKRNLQFHHRRQNLSGRFHRMDEDGLGSRAGAGPRR